MNISRIKDGNSRLLVSEQFTGHAIKDPVDGARFYKNIGKYEQDYYKTVAYTLQQ